MKTFDEALSGFGWEPSEYGSRLFVGDLEVVFEQLLFGQWYVGVYREGNLIAEKVPVRPGGSREVADLSIHGAIGDAYARYDSDARVHGPDDFEAFVDALAPLFW